jgi:hypothetical protein
MAKASSLNNHHSLKTLSPDSKKSSQTANSTSALLEDLCINPTRKIVSQKGSQRKPKVSKLKNICIRRHSQCSECTE